MAMHTMLINKLPDSGKEILGKRSTEIDVCTLFVWPELRASFLVGAVFFKSLLTVVTVIVFQS